MTPSIVTIRNVTNRSTRLQPYILGWFFYARALSKKLFYIVLVWHWDVGVTRYLLFWIFSSMQDDFFIVQVANEYDSVFESLFKTEFLHVLSKTFKNKLNRELRLTFGNSWALRFCCSQPIEIRCLCLTFFAAEIVALLHLVWEFDLSSVYDVWMLVSGRTSICWLSRLMYCNSRWSVAQSIDNFSPEYGLSGDIENWGSLRSAHMNNPVTWNLRNRLL